MEKLFKVYARAVILNDKNDVLIMKKNSNQKYGAGMLVLPGGTLEFGEEIENAVVREVKEETNLNVNSVKLIDVKKIILGNEHWVGFYYFATCDNLDNLMNTEPQKHELCDFISFDKIDSYGEMLHKDVIEKSINIA